MSNWIKKQFRNGDTTPVCIDVTAHCESSFVTVQLDDKVTDVSYDGPALQQGEDQRNSEVGRMMHWLYITFVGKSAAYFYSHDGLVPDAYRTSDRELPRKVNIETVVTPGTLSPEESRRLVERFRRSFSPLLSHPYRNVVRDVQHVGYASALPLIPPRFPYHMLAEGFHSGGTYASNLRREVQRPETTQELLDSVPYEGNELPPQPGEQYIYVLNQQTYTVVDVRRKHESTDVAVTMERDSDKRRSKYTYRNHATWLSMWSPVPEATLVHPKISACDKGADPMCKLSEAMRKAEVDTRHFIVTSQDGAVYDMTRILRELDKTLPHWQTLTLDSSRVYTQADKIIRALRSIKKHTRNYRQLAEAAADQALKLSEKNAELSSSLAARTREVNALKQERGGAWDAARVRREQDTMRELLRHYAKLFGRHYGKVALKKMLNTLDAECFSALPPEHFMLFVTKCEAHSAAEES